MPDPESTPAPPTYAYCAGCEEPMMGTVKSEADQHCTGCALANLEKRVAALEKLAAS